MNSTGKMPPRTGVDSEFLAVTSVIIPLYNHEKTVEKALESVLKSNCAEIELIISDDHSADNSYDKARKWVDLNRSNFKKIKLYRQEKNLGITKHLNFLVAQASGKYITLLASDDELTKSAIDIQVAILELNPGNDFLFCNVGLIDNDGNILIERSVSNVRSFIFCIRSLCVFDIVLNWGLPWSRLFAKRIEFQRFGNYIAEHSFEDRWSALNIANSKKFLYSNEVVHLYRMRKNGTATGGIDPKKLLCDQNDVERMMINKSSGLLRVLLTLRVKSLKGSCKNKWERLLWLIVRKSIESVYRGIVG